MEEVSVQACQISSVQRTAQHGVAENLAYASEFFSSAFPSRILNGQVEQFEGAVTGLFTRCRIFSLPTMGAGHITAYIGQLLN